MTAAALSPSDMTTPHDLEALYRAHYPRLLSIACGAFKSRIIGEDLVQSAALKVYRASHARPVPASFLYRTLRNLIIDHRRVEESRDRRLSRLAREMPTAAEQPAVDDGLAGAVAAAVARLSPSLQIVLRLRWYDGLSRPEIAARLGVTVNAVELRTTRALAALRTELTGRLS